MLYMMVHHLAVCNTVILSTMVCSIDFNNLIVYFLLYWQDVGFKTIVV